MISIPELSSSELVIRVSVSIVIVITSSLLIHYYRLDHQQSKRRIMKSSTNNDDAINTDPYAIDQCPNPNCIRCRKYAEVNESAQRLIPWLIADLKVKAAAPKDDALSSNSNHVEEDIRRVLDAVRVGPRLQDEQKRNTNASPRFGQYPTVLLVRGLSADPLVTHLHREGIEALIKRRERKVIMSEYLVSQQINKHGETCGSWLRNDVNDDDGGSWEVLHLLNQGVWNTTNLERCPVTASAVKSLSGLMAGCIFGNAFISVLRPGTVIEPHCGPSNVRHRLHFALQIPRDDDDDDEMMVVLQAGERSEQQKPLLTVAGVTLTWKEGECFVFDDSLTHSAVYPALSSQSHGQPVYSPMAARVVLIVDLWHPELTQLERTSITQLYPRS